MANDVFINIFYINIVLFNADITFTNGYGWGSNYKLEVFIAVFVSYKNPKSLDYILQILLKYYFPFA